jgi:hypothetical protein
MLRRRMLVVRQATQTLLKKGSVRFLLSWNDRAHIPAI